ncbi:MAG: 16S rRNA (guanine(966)-N(2))-methyltransferase RsmD [Rickettsiales bacterium]|nr:16S rRNA (guanine(966)-N(2))-methyltransferase RsmD [Rickettsiales bacterium]
MRIIAGKHKGRRIETPREISGDIRPTSDFAREAIFNILLHSKHGLNGHSFADQVVLDMYCGTGAFGLEALSRGAAHVTFLDQSRDALSIAKHNVERYGEATQADYIHGDATRLPKPRRRYGVVFLDPPYFSNLIPNTLKALHEGEWITDDGLVIIEHDAKETIAIPEPFTSIDQRRYGRAVLEVLTLS